MTAATASVANSTSAPPRLLLPSLTQHSTHNKLAQYHSERLTCMVESRLREQECDAVKLPRQKDYDTASKTAELFASSSGLATVAVGFFS